MRTGGLAVVAAAAWLVSGCTESNPLPDVFVEMRARIDKQNAEVAALRDELASVKAQLGAVPMVNMKPITDRLDALEAGGGAPRLVIAATGVDLGRSLWNDVAAVTIDGKQVPIAFASPVSIAFTGEHCDGDAFITAWADVRHAPPYSISSVRFIGAGGKLWRPSGVVDRSAKVLSASYIDHNGKDACEATSGEDWMQPAVAESAPAGLRLYEPGELAITFRSL